MHDDLGLRGNTTAYYEAANSFINVVLDRRRGIPISLAAIFISIARRLGITCHGITTFNLHLFISLFVADCLCFVFFAQV